MDQTFELLTKLADSVPVMVTLLLWVLIMALAPCGVMLIIGYWVIKNFKNVLEDMRDEIRKMATNFASGFATVSEKLSSIEHHFTDRIKDVEERVDIVEDDVKGLMGSKND